MTQEQYERIASSRTIRILLYHRLIPDDEGDSRARMDIPVGKFRQQVETLERWGFTTITLNDYRLYLGGELELPRRPIVMTFDDGYLDTYELAFPVLQEFGMRAVIFALGDRGIRKNLWENPLKIPIVSLMNDQQLLELHQAGFEIGSHSLSHNDLTELPEERAWEEISRSRMLLEIMLNASVKSFAYPYGVANKTLKRMVADAGYVFACTKKVGSSSFKKDPYEMRRIVVNNGAGLVAFAMKVLGPHMSQNWWKKQKVSRVNSGMR